MIWCENKWVVYFLKKDFHEHEAQMQRLKMRIVAQSDYVDNLQLFFCYLNWIGFWELFSKDSIREQIWNVTHA